MSTNKESKTENLKIGTLTAKDVIKNFRYTIRVIVETDHFCTKGPF